MISFNFKDGTTKSQNGRISAVNNRCIYVEEYQGQKDIYKINGGDIAFPENKLLFTDTEFYLHLSFLIDNSSKDMALLCPTYLPFQFNLIKATSGKYSLTVGMTVDGHIREEESSVTLAVGRWYDLELALLDGVFCFWIDGEISGRRVFAGTPKCEKIPKDSFLFCGKAYEKLSGFHGYLNFIEFSDKVSDKRKAEAINLADKGYRENDSKRKDLLIAGIDIGDLMTLNNIIEEQSNCIYDEYTNGVIFWSAPYKSVWMSTPIAKRYFDLLNTTYIGFPIEDERVFFYYGPFCMFDGGVIFYEAALSGKVFLVSDEFFTEYMHAGINTLKDGVYYSKYGVPVSEVHEISVGSAAVTIQNFTKYTMFRCGSNGAVCAVKNSLANRYLANPDKYGIVEQVINGYSGITGRYYTAALPSQYVEYGEASYLKCSDEILCLYHTYMEFSDGKRLNDKENIFTISNEFFDYFGAVLGLDEEKEYGVYKCPKDSKKVTASGTEYQDFLGGVFVKYKDGSFHAFSKVSIVLVGVSSGHIDDFITDRTAELYITVNLTHNGNVLVEKQRWPDYSERKHGGSEFSIAYGGDKVTTKHPEGENVHYDFKGIQGLDKIILTVKAYDWDEYSDNDYLGSYTIPLDIESGWGLAKDCIPDKMKDSIKTAITGTDTIYSGIWLMHEGGDNKHGQKNIRLTLRIEGKEEDEDEDVDDYFRKYGYWMIDNYHYQKGSKVPRMLFDTTFGVSTGSWYDWVLNFWDSVWYEVVNKDYNGEGGQCFGLSVEALRAINSMSEYNVKLCKWNVMSSTKLALNGKEEVETDTDVDSNFAELIRAKHLYQCGWAHIKMTVKKMREGKMVAAAGFLDIKKIIDSEGYCITNLFNPGGHTVLAYKYDESGKIFVANCNVPWWVSEKRYNAAIITAIKEAIDEVIKANNADNNAAIKEVIKAYNAANNAAQNAAFNAAIITAIIAAIIAAINEVIKANNAAFNAAIKEAIDEVIKANNAANNAAKNEANNAAIEAINEAIKEAFNADIKEAIDEVIKVDNAAQNAANNAANIEVIKANNAAFNAAIDAAIAAINAAINAANNAANKEVIKANNAVIKAIKANNEADIKAENEAKNKVVNADFNAAIDAAIAAKNAANNAANNAAIDAAIEAINAAKDKDNGYKDSSYIKLSDSGLKALLHDYGGAVVKEYALIYGTPYNVIAKNPYVPSWCDLYRFTFDTLFKGLGEFVVRNLVEFISAISSGDCIIQDVIADGKTGAAFNIPALDLVDATTDSSQESLGSVGFAACIAQNTAHIKIKGTRDGSARVYIGTRNQIIEINEKLSKGESKMISMEQLNTGHPIAVVSNGNSTKEIKCGKAIISKYGENASSIKFKEVSPLKAERARYYINRKAQKKGDHEIHRDSGKCLARIKSNNLIFLGTFTDPREALKEGEKIFDKCDGCYLCCHEIDHRKR